MSQQVDDNFIYNDKEYILMALEYPKKFLDLKKFKLKPIEMSTACWRGFVITFAVKNNQLIVDQILTNNQTYTKSHKRKTIVINEINGVFPEIIEPKGLIDVFNEYRILHYNNLNYTLNYTGAIIIVKDFINKYITGPYAFLSISPFCYKEIIKLNFMNGILTNTKDLSNYGIKIRLEKNNILNEEENESAYSGWPDIDVLFKNDT